MTGVNLQDILLLYCSAVLTVIMLALLYACKVAVKKKWSELITLIASATGYADYEQTLDEWRSDESAAAAAAAAAAIADTPTCRCRRRNAVVDLPEGVPNSSWGTARAARVQLKTPQAVANAFATQQPRSSLPAHLALARADTMSPLELPPGRPLAAAAAEGATKIGDPDPGVLESYTSPQGILHSVPDLDLMSAAAASAANSAKAAAATAAAAAMARGLAALSRAGSYISIGSLSAASQRTSPAVASPAVPAVADDADKVAARHEPVAQEPPQPPAAEATAPSRRRRSSARESEHLASEAAPPHRVAGSRLDTEDGKEEPSMVTPARLAYGRVLPSLVRQLTEDGLRQSSPTSPVDPEALDSPRGVLHTTPPLDFSDAEIGGVGDGASDDEDIADASEVESAGERGETTADPVQPSARSRIPLLTGPGGLPSSPALATKPWGDRKQPTPPTMKRMRWPKRSRDLVPE